MKSIIYRLIAGLILVSALGGCHTIKQESAMEWLERQPRNLDP